MAHPQHRPLRVDAMSERKTAEIKFRIAPSEKARWQASADAIEDGLSEFVRRCVEQSILQHDLWARENANFDGTKLLEAGIPLAPNPNLPEGELWVVDMDKVILERTQPLTIIKNVTDAQGVCPGPGGCSACPSPEACRSLRAELGLEDETSQEDVPCDVCEGTHEIIPFDALMAPLAPKEVQAVPLGPAADMAQKFPSPKPWTFEGQNA